MRLDIRVYTVLLAGGLGAAYWASLPTTEGGDEEKISVFAIDPKSVTEISYKSKDVEAVATKRAEDGRYWVTHTKTEVAPVPPPPKDPKDAKPKDSAPGTKVTTEHFLANELTEELLKSMNPLYATRVFATVDAKQLSEFGLSEKSEVVKIKGEGGKEFTLYLGKRSFGSRNRFAQEGEGKGRVLLIDDQGFENVERAPLRLYDRRLVKFDFSDAVKAEIHAGAKQKTLGHTQREKTGALLWTEDKEGAPKHDSYDIWMEKIGKLRLANYGEVKDEERFKSAQPFLDINFFGKDGKQLDHLAFLKISGDKPGDKPEYWLTSDFLKVHVKVVDSRVEPIEKDIAQIVEETKS